MCIEEAKKRCIDLAGGTKGGWFGAVECPKCGSRWLHFYYTIFAGLEWMECSTEGCISWRKEPVKRARKIVGNMTAEDMVQLIKPKKKPKPLLQF